MSEGKKSLGQVLKEARKRRNYTLTQAEELTGISNAYLSQLENGKAKKPSAHVLQKLADCYELDFDFLLEEAGIIRKKTETERKAKTFAGHALFSADLSAEEEEELAKYLHYLRFKKSK